MPIRRLVASDGFEVTRVVIDVRVAGYIPPLGDFMTQGMESSGERYFAYSQGEWKQLKKKDVAKSKGADYICSVFSHSDDRQLIVVAPVNRRVAPKAWPSEEDYDLKDWRTREVGQHSPYSLQTTYFGKTQKVREIATDIQVDNETFVFSQHNGDERIEPTNVPCRVDIQFSCKTADDTQKDQYLFLRAVLVSNRETTIFQRLEKFSEKVLRKLLKVIFPSGIDALTLVSPVLTEVDGLPTEESGENQPGKIEKFISTRVNPIKEKLIELAARNPRYVSMFILFILYFVLALVVRSKRDGYYVWNATNKVRIWHPDGSTQLFFAVLVVLAPIFLALTGSLFRKSFEKFLKRNDDPTRNEFNRVQVKKREQFSADIYGTVVGIRLLLEYLIFSLFIYLLVSALAWKRIDSTHHWVWSDRQTIGFVFTILLSIFAALFSNSLRDLFQQNNETREKIEVTVVKTRHLLDELTELSDRMWSEFEVEFKEDGKVFLYRANEYVNHSSSDQKVIVPLVSGLSTAIQGSIVSLNDSNGAERWSEELAEFDPVWKENELNGPGGVLRLDRKNRKRPLRFEPWALTIRPSDISSNEVSDDYDIENIHKYVKETTFRSTGDIRSLLIEIVQYLTDPHDGRFYVIGNLDEESKNRLAIQRRYKSLVAFVVTKREEKKKRWGYFPTDESVTYSIMNLMLQDQNWLASASGSGFREWLTSVYKNLSIFHHRNEARFRKMDDLLSRTSQLLDDQGIPSSLLLDDLFLFREILRTGSDSPFSDGQSLNDQQMKTTARIITYAASFYAAMVWNAGPDRALFPTFPSPFAGLIDELPNETQYDELVMHPATRLFKLERAVHKALQGAVVVDDFEGPAWSMALELSYRQGPLTNWVRSARAYRSRENFLYSQQPQLKEVSLISRIADSRTVLMEVFFPNPKNESSDSDERAVQSRASRLLESKETTKGFFSLGGPRSLKVLRKSAIRSLLTRDTHVQTK